MKKENVDLRREVTKRKQAGDESQEKNQVDAAKDREPASSQSKMNYNNTKGSII